MTLRDSKAFSGFSANDIPKARQFYSKAARSRGHRSEWHVDAAPCRGAQCSFIPSEPHAGNVHDPQFPVTDIESTVTG